MIEYLHTILTSGTMARTFWTEYFTSLAEIALHYKFASL